MKVLKNRHASILHIAELEVLPYAPHLIQLIFFFSKQYPEQVDLAMLDVADSDAPFRKLTISGNETWIYEFEREKIDSV